MNEGNLDGEQKEKVASDGSEQERGGADVANGEAALAASDE